MTEMFMQLDGLEGVALRLMKDEHGWSMRGDLTLQETKQEGEMLTCEVVYKYGLYKYGQPATQEQFQEELKDVWCKLNGVVLK